MKNERGSSRLIIVACTVALLSGAVWGSVSWLASSAAESKAQELLADVARADALCLEEKFPEAQTAFETLIPQAEEIAEREPMPLSLGLRSLAEIYRVREDHQREIETLEKRLALSEQMHGADSILLRNEVLRLAEAYLQNERLQDAAASYDRAIQLMKNERGLGDVDSIVGLAKVRIKQGRLADAEALARQAVTELGGNPVANASTYAAALNLVGESLRRAGDLEEAATWVKQAYEFRDSHFGRSHPEYADGLFYQGVLDDSMGDWQSADIAFSKAALVLGQARSFYRQRVRDKGIAEWALLNELSLRKTSERFALAHELLGESKALRTRAFGNSHPRLGEVYMAEARVYRAEGRRNHAIALEIQAKEMRD